IEDRAQVPLSLPKLLLRALAVVDIDVEPKPAEEVALIIVDRRRRYVEPAIVSVGATKAHLRSAALTRTRDTLPPHLECVDVRRVNGRFPLRSGQLIQSKARVLQKSWVEKIQPTIRQSRPGKRRDVIDESSSVECGAAFIHARIIHARAQAALPRYA